jgi:hypothetical protein
MKFPKTYFTAALVLLYVIVGIVAGGMAIIGLIYGN